MWRQDLYDQLHEVLFQGTFIYKMYIYKESSYKVDHNMWSGLEQIHASVVDFVKI